MFLQFTDLEEWERTLLNASQLAIMYSGSQVRHNSKLCTLDIALYKFKSAGFSYNHASVVAVWNSATYIHQFEIWNSCSNFIKLEHETFTSVDLSHAFIHSRCETVLLKFIKFKYETFTSVDQVHMMWNSCLISSRREVTLFQEFIKSIRYETISFSWLCQNVTVILHFIKTRAPTSSQNVKPFLLQFNKLRYI